MAHQKVHSRKSWGAKYENGFGARPLPASRAFLHHSVTHPYGADATFKEDAASMRTLDNIGEARFHRGISYNRVVMQSGRVFSGVSIDRIGAHTGGYNTKAVGVVCVGNYSTVSPNSHQIAALTNLLRHMREEGQVKKTVKYEGHRDVKATACPGNALYRQIPHINALANDGRDFDKTVKFGQESFDVKWVQIRLISLGYDVVANGKFTAATTVAVQALHKKLGWKSNGGKVGPRTWAYIATR